MKGLSTQTHYSDSNPTSLWILFFFNIAYFAEKQWFFRVTQLGIKPKTSGVDFTKSGKCEMDPKLWRHNAISGCDVITYDFLWNWGLELEASTHYLVTTEVVFSQYTVLLKSPQLNQWNGIDSHKYKEKVGWWMTLRKMDLCQFFVIQDWLKMQTSIHEVFFVFNLRSRSFKYWMT